MYTKVEIITVRNTGIKNFGVATCTFVDLAGADGTWSWTGGILEFMQTVQEDNKIPLLFNLIVTII